MKEVVRRYCPVCGEDESRVFVRTRDYNWGIPGQFTYVRCVSCGLVRRDPMPSSRDIPRLYPPCYGTWIDADSDREARIDTPINNHRAALLEKNCGKGRLFDIGCGSGFFLEFMRRRGWEPGGIEPSPRHVHYARERLNLDAVSQGLWPRDCPVDTEADAVAMIHVLEHFRDPKQSLAEARQVLKPGGAILIETPNLESWAARLFGKRCTIFDAPRHLYLFAPATLKRILRAAGLAPVEITTYSPSLSEYTESLRYLIADLGLRSYPPKNPASSGSPAGASEHALSVEVNLFHRLERLTFALFDRASRASNHGCALLAVARRIA